MLLRAVILKELEPWFANPLVGKCRGGAGLKAWKVSVSTLVGFPPVTHLSLQAHEGLSCLQEDSIWGDSQGRYLLLSPQFDVSSSATQIKQSHSRLP